MFAWFAKFAGRRDGVSAVEFALMLPLTLLIVAGIIEMGRAMYQTTLLDQGLRAAGLYGSRADYPLSSEIYTRMDRLAKTGSLEPGAPFLLNSWTDAASNLDINIGTYDLDGRPIPVIELEANVPYHPLIPGLFEMFGFNNFTLYARHEQAYIGQ